MTWSSKDAQVGHASTTWKCLDITGRITWPKKRRFITAVAQKENKFIGSLPVPMNNGLTWNMAISSCSCCARANLSILGLLSGTKKEYNSAALQPLTTVLLTLDGFVYVTDKEQCGTETDHAQHQEESIADASHVAEEEWCLHKSRHIWSCIIVVQTVPIDKKSSWSST